MKNYAVRIAVFCILVLAAVNCQRATNETSRLLLQLPTYTTHTKVGALTCTTQCLKVIIVNVDGADFPTIRYNQKQDRIDESATQLNSKITLDVPSGPSRKIQILAIYRSADSKFEMQYGSVVTDILDPEPPPIPISMSKLVGTDGQSGFKGGSIVGRYLTGADSGPTGHIIMSINHAASGLSMDLFEEEILNGWFNFFTTENFSMSYRLKGRTPSEDKPLLGLQDVNIESLVPLVGSSSVDHIARIHRPSMYFRTHNSWATSELINESHDIVYGYFSPRAELLASKKVCLQYNPSAPAGMSFSRLSLIATGTTLLTYHHNKAIADTYTPSADIYGVGGLSSSAVNCTDAVMGSSVSANRFALDRISINQEQFNGNGNDTAKSIGGAFTYIVEAMAVRKYQLTAGNYTFKGLPGLFTNDPLGSTNVGIGPLFNGVKLFKKPSVTSGGFDHLRCNLDLLATNGFTEVAGFSTNPALTIAAGDTANITFSMTTAPLSTDGFILCPTRDGALIGLGGFFVGNLL